ncbi:Gfo/Idh/MocA family protein [Streptomyces beihaiensis]|uniref:Gfo/Idh/MocA family oxidoreductase n=1 Tax=Streptomyces beihaiensis TaxID=2984495 RepID=A0ABT3TR04_9ACTN|nr:Gfo/Idh/MocA family oxidoreductase [Streptomyces beihaiensis]MCX3059479.1 Gfo/Idh/MocA family oxidoreductase [Streptomyces beihaiensis]
MSTPRIGIIGLGVISRFYVEALNGEVDDIELAAVCDLNDEVLAPHRGRIPTFRDHRELLADTALDAVVVNVPNDVHFAVCRDALEAGVSVCVEKPLGITVGEGRALRELAARKGVALFTAYHRRYNTNVLDLLAALPADVPVEELTVRYWEKIEEHVGKDRWYLDPARCGGGCVADNGPNAIDVVHLLLGEVAVTDVRITHDRHGVDRQAVISLATPDGARAVVDLDWAYAHGERKDVEVRLADGRILSADMLAGYPRFKSSLAHEYVGVLREFGQVLRGELAHWPDGLETLEIVTAAYAAERARAA